MGRRNNANVLGDLLKVAAAYGVRKRAATLAKKGKPWSVPDCSGWA